MSFTNRVRLPIRTTKPQWLEQRTSFVKANGQVQTQSVVLQKQYILETEWLGEFWHEIINIALAHDNVTIENERYLGGVSKNGDYNVSWNTFKDYPTAPATCNLYVTPFNAINNNCQTCEEASQLQLADEDMGTVTEDETTAFTPDVSSICCSPVVFSLVSYNTDYLSAASIDADTGEITLTTKTGLTDAVGLTLVTYRATCPNGNFDDANITATVDGSISGCLAPVGLSVESITSSDIDVGWTASAGDPADGWDVQIWQSGGGSPLASANIPGASRTCDIATDLMYELSPATSYIIYVRANCGGTQSNYVTINVTTSPAGSSLCGEYNFTYNNPTQPGAGAGGHINASYLDCNGENQTLYVPNGVDRPACAMQTRPGAPVDIHVSEFNQYFSYSYQEPCP